jgi:hypothetical protein
MLPRTTRAFVRSISIPLAARALTSSSPLSSRRWFRVAAVAAAAAAVTGLYAANASPAATAACSPPSVVLAFGLGLSGENAFAPSGCCSPSALNLLLALSPQSDSFNRLGQLGNGDTRSSSIPVAVTSPSPPSSAPPSSCPPHFTRIAAGGNSSAAIDTFGEHFATRQSSSCH